MDLRRCSHGVPYEQGECKDCKEINQLRTALAAKELECEGLKKIVTTASSGLQFPTRQDMRIHIASLQSRLTTLGSELTETKSCLADLESELLETNHHLLLMCDTARGLAEERNRYKATGAKLANVAYNLAQRAGDPLAANDIDILGQLRKEWDELVRKNAQIAGLKRDLERAEAYPTEEAYLAVCAARTKWQERAEAAGLRIQRLRTGLDEITRVTPCDPLGNPFYRCQSIAKATLTADISKATE